MSPRKIRSLTILLVVTASLFAIYFAFKPSQLAIHKGMTIAEVEAVLGPRISKRVVGRPYYFSMEGKAVDLDGDYFYTWQKGNIIFDVGFRNGIVVDFHEQHLAM